MMRYKGKIVFEGYAIGDSFVYFQDEKTSLPIFSSEENEINRFIEARSKAVKELEKLYEETLQKLGEEEAVLFQTHKLMAEDLDFEDLVKANILNRHVAEVAVENASKELSKSLAQLDDEYMKLRAADAVEVGNQIVNILTGKDAVFNLEKPCVIIANDLPSSALMKFDRKKILGLVLINGNVNSHVSILARTLEIPTVVGIENTSAFPSYFLNKEIIVDAISGEVICNHNKDDISKYKKKQQEYEDEIKALKSYVGKPSITKDGHQIKVYANIASNLEIENVEKNDAEGVGLFRSEFVYLAAKSYPSEDLQFNYYREVLEDMKGKEVIIRTLDIGADKKVDYFELPEEENPALGYRSIRICRDRPELFKTQIRALYRASAYGKLSIMIPMIISVEEVEYAKEMCEEVKKDLDSKGIKYDKNVKFGIMIETPSAAIISDELAKHVDFFSIGTNDLSQYTLACDRLNPMLNKTFNSRHQAILRLIKLVVENAHKEGVVVGMCGELARDSELIPFWAGIHMDELSCSAAYCLKVRKAICEIDTSKIDINKYINF